MTQPTIERSQARLAPSTLNLATLNLASLNLASLNLAALKLATVKLVTLALISAASLSGQTSEPPPTPTTSMDSPDIGLMRPLEEPAGAPLQGAELDEATVELSSKLRCPVCQNLSVADSPSPSAIAIRDEVQDLFAQGYQRDQIVTYFEQRYGEFVRLVPKFTPFNVLVWVVPAVGILGGLFLVLRTAGLGKSTDVRQADDETDEDELTAYRERVRQELSQ